MTALGLLVATQLALAPPAPSPPAPSPHDVRIQADDKGAVLLVEGKPMMVLGMNWGYVPVGTNYRYDFWSQPESMVKAALARELGLLKAMGANVIRQYDTIPPKWVTYIYDEFGIFTAVNNLTGRYGINVDGAFVNPIDYSNPAHRKAVLDSVRASVARFRETRGVLMYMLGNENNYGLEWSSSEIEALPKGERHAAKAKHLYSLWGEAAAIIKAADPRPITLTNGDLQYLDLIVEHCGDVDIMGSNVYRGASARDLYERVWKAFRKPFVYTEFGADAYDAKNLREDGAAQARYLRAQWQEIYEQSWGKGRVGNAIGGFIFQWSDGWWKYKQTTNLDVQDNNASWPNAAYPDDFVAGKNNMNEEWFGICAKGLPDAQGHFDLYPRHAYYLLKEAFRLDPYAATTSLKRIREHFGRLDVGSLGAPYERSALGRRLDTVEMFRGTNMRMNFETFTTGGAGLTDAARERTRFDHLQSFWLDFRVHPAANLDGGISVNLRGNRPANPIDEIFYEDRDDVLQIHGAHFKWDSDYFGIDGFYRTGHYHWGYEGDFFGLYREANYGQNIDIYQGTAPFGAEVRGKGALEGLAVAFGPEIYWGANPQVLAKYHRTFGNLEFSLMHQEDIARQETVTSTFGVPEPVTRKSSIYLGWKRNKVALQIGGLIAGTERIGDSFTAARESGGAGYAASGFDFLQDEIAFMDTLGAKAKLSVESGRWHWYAQGVYKGLVADGGPDQTVTFTGWSLKEAGRGNHIGALTGLAVTVGDFQIAPSFLYQKPIEPALPSVDEFYAVDTNTFYPGVTPRNVLDDPFAVQGNREQIAFELVLSYDPTPGTWLWNWDNEIVEDAVFAASLDFVYRIQPEARDSGLAVFDFGLAPFGVAPPAQDVWEAKLRLISNPGAGVRLIGNLWTGQVEPTSGDERRIFRKGIDVKVAWRKLLAQAVVKLDDWGPYDYHRDFNLTFPVQAIGDVSWALNMPRWLGQLYSRVGIRGQVRTLNSLSPRYRQPSNADPSNADPSNADQSDGEQSMEWEVRTYVHITL
ncbi:MAG: beta-galactosidase [Myxococcota bacterium]|jgi:beta-galactosidase